MKIIIVEDEILLAQRLQRLCQNILGNKLSSIKLFSNLGDADDYVSSNTIDLMFLDLNLQGQDGFQLLKKNMAGAFHTIVVSAYANRAIEAFEYGVLDFVPKPFTEKRIKQAIDRLENNDTRTDQHATKYVSVKKLDSIEIIAVSNILYLKGAGNYSELFLKDGETRLHDKSLSRLLDILPNKFDRLHKSFVVAMDCVVSLEAVSSSDYQAVLNNGVKVPISRTKVKELRHL